LLEYQIEELIELGIHTYKGFKEEVGKDKAEFVDWLLTNASKRLYDMGRKLADAIERELEEEEED
jgi:DNA-binding ferritin-like protein (Dps family)